jgi:alpha-D-ribose 1-methylphosphonate 5-triphosphate diphosphatase
MVAPLLESPLSRLVSLMDHTPGQRQFTDIAKFYEYYQGRFGYNDAQMAEMIARGQAEAELFSGPNRRAIVAMCIQRNLKMASHDDATPEHVAESLGLGLTISEFPTTVLAAEAARAGGMTTIMGAPNVVRGGSHSGNVSAAELARLGLLDALSSDYVPVSLGHAAFKLHNDDGIALPDAVAKISLNPARMLGLTDRGEIAIGKRADLVRLSLLDGLPIVRQVWRAGERVI